MNRLEKIKEIKATINNGKPKDLIVLHCVSYPTGKKIYTDTNGKRINLEDLPENSMKVIFESGDYSNDPRMKD